MRLLVVLSLLATLVLSVVFAQPSPPSGFTLSTRNTFPSASTTGVPAGTNLTNYTDSCSITTNNTVIDSKIVNCTLEIRAQNITIRKSEINGSVEIYTDEGAFTGGSASNSLLIEDSHLVGPTSMTYAGAQDGLGEKNWVARRIRITGFRRAMHCLNNCTLEYSLIHQTGVASSNQTEPFALHQSGIRVGPNATIRGNWIACDAPDMGDAGCSANMTMYGEYGTVHDVLIENNYFPATHAGYCTYAGNTHGNTSAYNIRFINNVYGRRGHGNSISASQNTVNGASTCGYYGTNTSYLANSGNVWTGNKFLPDGYEVPY